MTTTDIIYTPFDLSEARPAGRRRFWKQVLPVTKINYKGQEVNFDPEFHMDLAQAFEEKAFDQVPIVFANGENQHNMDPRNFGGDVVHMEYRGPGKDQGTWALIEADKDAAKQIKRNPKLGVSARIRQLIDKADGRQFKRAIEHVCLTMNPRVTGMSPWQAVDLSEDTDSVVVDLTAADYEGNEMKASTKTRRGQTPRKGTIDLSSLSDDEFQRLLDLAQGTVEDEEVDEDDLEDEDPDDLEVEDTARRKPRKKKSRTKVVIDKESEDDGDDEEEDEEEDGDVDDETDLSDSDKVIKAGERSQFQQMRLDLAEEKWERERTAYIDAGVPPFLVDLADDILSLPDAVTIDLADSDETIDASATVRKMLDGIKGVVDLTGEFGSAMDLTVDEGADAEATAFLNEWDKQYG